MSFAQDRKLAARQCVQNCLIILLVNLLIFPPGLRAAEVSITWNGASSNNYSDTGNWNCLSCGGATYPNNGNLGNTYDATINSGGTDLVNLDVAGSGSIINSLILGGSGPSSTSTFNVGGGNTITIGTPAVTSGNVLAIESGGILNINSGGSVTLELSGGAGALNDTGGQISVTDGGTLTLQNNTANGNSTFTDNGNISVIGSSSTAALVLNANPPAGATFDLAGTGTLTLGGMGELIDSNGVESLNNDAGHTIAGDGLVSVSANIANAGTLHASTYGASLIVTSNNLTNWNGATGTLTGGSYVVDNGATLQLSNIGAANSIQTLSNANVTVAGTGLVTGDGVANALSGLNTITSNDSLAGNGTASLTLSGSTQTLTGGLTNVANALNGNYATSALALNSGATLTMGALLNQANIAFPGFTSSANANVNVSGGSTLNVDSVATSTNNGFASSTITVSGTGSSMNVSGDFQQGGIDPGSYSSGNDILNILGGGAVTVGGDFSNNNGLNSSQVNLTGGSLTVDGTFSETTANNGFGRAQLNLTSNSVMTVGALTIGNVLTNVTSGTPTSSVSIDSGSSLTVLGAGNFTNINGVGLLSGGSYFIGSGASLNYTGANIGTIDFNAALTLDNALNTTQGAVLNGGSDAISNSLTTVNGSLTLQNNANLTLSGATPATFTVGPGGSLTIQNNSNLDVSAYNFTNVSGGLLSGGNYLVGTNSTLNYASSQGAINTIDLNTSLTLDNSYGGNTGSITNGVGNDAISNSLSNVNGSLTVQNLASLTLSSSVPSFTVGPNGTLTVWNYSNMDVSATNFNNVTTGTLSGGNYFIGTDSTLNYAGSQGAINTIDFNTALTLDNGEDNVTGTITSGGVDAISNSLTTNNGILALQNGANLTLSQAFSNNGSVTLDYYGGGSSTLTANAGFTNYNAYVSLNNNYASYGSTLNVTGNFANTADDSVGDGQAALTLIGSNATLTGDLNNSATSNFGGAPTAFVGLIDNSGTASNLSVNNLNNTATDNSGFGSPTANVSLTNSNLSVGGSINNTAIDNVGESFAQANVNLTGGSLTVAGDVTNQAIVNTQGNGTNINAAFSLTNVTGATIAGNLTNQVNTLNNGYQNQAGGAAQVNLTSSSLSVGGSVSNVVNDAGSFAGEGAASINLTNSTLAVTGGLTNAVYDTGGSNHSDAAAIFLESSTLTVGGTLTNGAGAGGTNYIYLDAGSSLGVTGSFTNTGATLELSNSGDNSVTVGGLLYNDSNSTISLDGGGNTLTGTGNFTNYGTINVGAGDTADFRNGGLGQLTNLTGGTLYGGTYNISGSLFYDTGGDGASTSITALNGSNVSLTGSGAILFGSGGGTNALSPALNSIYSGSTGAASLSFNSISGGPLSLTPTGGVLAVLADDLEFLGTNNASLNLSGTTATVSGDLTNNANAYNGYSVNSSINLSNGSSLTVNNLTNQGIANSGDFNSASAQVNLTGASSLTVNGNVQNTSLNSSFEGSATASVNLSGGSSLGVTGTFTNTAASLSLSGASTATVGGLFYNDGNSGIYLNGGGNTLYGNGGFTNLGSLYVGAGDTADFRVGGATGTSLDTFTNLSGGTLTGGTFNIGGTFNYDASAGAGLGQILAMQGANITLNGTGQILYGPGAGSDALAALAGINDSTLTYNSAGTHTINPTGGTLAVTVDNDNTSTLAVNGSNLTVGGNLAVNGGFGSTAVNLTAGNLTVDGTVTTSGGGFSSGINLNSSGGTGSTLTTPGLVNIGSGSYISLNGGGNQLIGTGNLTNNGTLTVGGGDTADFRNSGAGQLTNLSGNTLTGGTYNLAGQFFYDTGGDGTSTNITAFNGVSMALAASGGGNPAGGIFYGSGAGTNALLNLSTLTNSGLAITGETLTITPTLNSGTFVLDPSALSLTGSSLTIAGGLNNTNGSSIGLNYLGNQPTGTASTLTIQGALNNTGSSIALNGGGNVLTAQSYYGDASSSVQVGQGDTFNAGIWQNLANNTLTGGTYNITGSFLYSTGIDGSTWVQNLAGGASVTIGTGSSIAFGAGPTPALGELANITNSALTIQPGGSLTINPLGNNSALTLDPSTLTLNGASLTVQGAVNNFNASNISLNYSGGPATLTIAGALTNGQTPTDTLATVNLNGGGNTLTAQGFTNNGTLYVGAQDTANFTTGGHDTFTNLSANGVLTGGNYDIAGTFQFDPSSGGNGGILVIGANTTLTLDSLGGNNVQVIAGTGSGISGLSGLNEIAGTLNIGTNGQEGGVAMTQSLTPQSGTLTVDNGGALNVGGGNASWGGDTTVNINGNLAVNTGGSMTLGEGWQGTTGTVNVTDALTNAGTINLNYINSGLTTGGSLTNTGTLNVNYAGDFANSQGLNNAGGTINIVSGATLDARTGGTGTFSNLDGTTGTLGGGGTFNVGGSFLFDPASTGNGGNILVIGANTTLALTSSSAAVLYGPNELDAIASLTEVTGTLTLENGATHTFTPTTGTFLVDSTGTLNIGVGTNDAKAYVSGALTNNGTVNLNGAYGTLNDGTGAYDALNVSGALVNNSAINMSSYDSSLNIGGDFTNSSNGILTVSNQYNSIYVTGVLNNAGTINLAGNYGNPNAGLTVLNVTGALTNSGAFTYSGYDSTAVVGGDLTNSGTFTQSDYGYNLVNVGGNLNNLAAGTYTVGYGDRTNVTLALSNAATGIITVNGGGILYMDQGVDNSGAITVGNNLGGGQLVAGAPFVNEASGVLTVNNSSTVTAPGLTNNGTLSVLAGGLANFQGGGAGSFTNLSGGTLTGGTYDVGGTFQFDSADGVITGIGTGTSLTLDAQNGGAYAVLSGSSNALATLNSNAGTLTLTNGVVLNTNTDGPGVFTNTGTITTTGTGSNAFNVTGSFANTNPGVINLNGVSDTLTATGAFTNTGAVNLNGNSASVSSAGVDNQSGGTLTLAGNLNVVTSTGVTSNEGSISFTGTNGTLTSSNGFTNTGTVTTAVGGSNNQINVTGAVFNTSPGVVNLNGTGDKMTATGQLTNSGAVNLNGASASVSSVGLDNQSGGTVTLAGNLNSVTSTGTGSNEGTIAFNGTNGTVSSDGNFTNAASGIVTVTGTGNVLSTGENLFNSGAITVGSGGSVTAALGFSQEGGSVTIDNGGSLTVQSDNYEQTAGTTAVNTGGSLTAALFDLAGGTLTGGGTITGNLTVDGGTLNPGDPQSIDVTGNYDQTLAGLLDLDLASPTSYDQLDVGGTTSLGGTLDLTLEGGFAATVGTIFDIINSTGALSGNFNTFNDPTFNGGTETFQEVINGNQVDLDVVSTVQPSGTPEPSSMAMILCAGLMGAGVTWRIRRRRTAHKARFAA